MDEYEMRPCPFCGGEMMVSFASRPRRFVFRHKRAGGCVFCAFVVDRVVAGTLAEAIEAWNRRAEDVEFLRKLP